MTQTVGAPHQGAGPTPYDASAKLFTIGLKPLDPADWLTVGDDLDALLDEKARLNRDIPADVFVEEADSRDAQLELLDLLIGYLPTRHGATYRREADAMLVNGARRVRLDDAATPPLLTASSMAADDLLLMRRGEAGWRLAAASLCFPSSWTLSEKFGRPMNEIHDPVPGFGTGTRNAGLIDRMFDNLPRNQPVIRWNWSLQGDLTLYNPLSDGQRDERAGARPRRFPAGAAGAFFRVERQTLRKLSGCGDIVFTIRIHLDPMAALAVHPERERLALSLAGQLEGLDAAQLDYKGLAGDRDRLAADLREIGAKQKA